MPHSPEREGRAPKAPHVNPLGTPSSTLAGVCSLRSSYAFGTRRSELQVCAGPSLCLSLPFLPAPPSVSTRAREDRWYLCARESGAWMGQPPARGRGVRLQSGLAHVLEWDRAGGDPCSCFVPRRSVSNRLPFARHTLLTQLGGVSQHLLHLSREPGREWWGRGSPFVPMPCPSVASPPDPWFMCNFRLYVITPILRVEEQRWEGGVGPDHGRAPSPPDSGSRERGSG